MGQDKQSVLREYFGHTEFRPGQQDVVDAILTGRDVLGIMPTGAGKSICYQVPALLMDGLTIVVSPLISLMKDQVNALELNGVSVAYINSTLNAQQYGEVFRLAARKAYRILYVAPERLLTNDFLTLCRQVPVSMVTVDEAHCISQWGQDFRPSYLKVAQFIATLPKRPVVSAFTATATHEVRDDILSNLQMRAPLTVTTGFDRPNLHFSVQHPEDKALALRQIVARHRSRCGIVYCATRKAVEAVYDDLRRQRVQVTRYHAGLDEQERHQNQDDFLYDRKLVMVATNAFGMGIDKSNVSYVVHYNMPKNVESYYQEAGRAGRDGSPAECTLLFGRQDIRTNRFLIENGNENQALTDVQRQLLIARDLERLRMMASYCATGQCLRAYMLEYFGEPAKPYCGNCSSCLTPHEETDITREAQIIATCVHRMAQRNLHFGKTMLGDVLSGSKNERIRKYRLHELASYGQLARTPRRSVDRMVDCLLDEGYLRSSDDRYPVLMLTPEANSLMSGQERLVLRLPAGKATPAPFGKGLPAGPGKASPAMPVKRSPASSAKGSPASATKGSPVSAGRSASRPTAKTVRPSAPAVRPGRQDGCQPGVPDGSWPSEAPPEWNTGWCPPEAPERDGSSSQGVPLQPAGWPQPGPGPNSGPSRWLRNGDADDDFDNQETLSPAQADARLPAGLAGPVSSGMSDSEDNELLTLLKQVRRMVSANERVPAYLIFSDNTLRDLCQKMPLTKAEFLDVSGVGTVKAEKYWEAFTTVIRTYMEAHGYKRVQQKAQDEPNQMPKPAAGKPAAGGANPAGSGDAAWTDAEDRQLKAEFESGISVATICIIHHRTIGSVKRRLQALGLA